MPKGGSMEEDFLVSPWIAEEMEDGEDPWVILISNILNLSFLEDLWIIGSWIYLDLLFWNSGENEEDGNTF